MAWSEFVGAEGLDLPEVALVVILTPTGKDFCEASRRRSRRWAGRPETERQSDSLRRQCHRLNEAGDGYRGKEKKNPDGL